MRYSSYINNFRSLEWGISVQEAYVFGFLYECSAWADKLIIGSDVYYFASRNKAIKEIPLLTDKPDTMYRYYKRLEQVGLVDFKKVDGKDYVMITEMGKTWNEYKSEDSENNPKKLGRKSENNSEENPTYNNNNINNYNKIDNTIDHESFEIEYTHEIVRHLNLTSGKKFRPVSHTITLISELLKEGYTVEDIKKVNENMTLLWRGKENEKYLRPATIYKKEKFEGYLNLSPKEDNNNFNQWRAERNGTAIKDFEDI